MNRAGGAVVMVRVVSGPCRHEPEWRKAKQPGAEDKQEYEWE